MTVVTGDIQRYSNDNDINLYPNPAQNEITVGLENLKNGVPVEVAVYDLNGKRLDHKIGTGGGSLTIEVKHYVQGNYIIRAVQEQRAYSKQFLKE